MATNEDLLFLELALKREILTQEQVDEILTVQKKLAEMGRAEPVADLLVKKNILPAVDADAIRAKVSPKGGRQQIKGYRLIERLGRGGMGSVYKAVQISMGRTVALKVLKPSLVKDDQSTSRLRREAQLVGQMRHTNIVQGLDFGVSNGFHYFAMEYVEGQSAKELIEADGPIKESTALRIVTQVAKALEHAHQEGVVHRDVKPGNILIAKDGTAMLADYGLAKGPLEDGELTRSGVTVGTPQYISPEQARGPSDVDIRTDIYSLGATFYHMLTGRPPYEGDTLAHLIQQVLYEPCAPVRSLRRDVSPSVAFLVAKMMARKPAHRYQSPKALLKDLKAIEDGRPIVPAGWEGSFEALATKRRATLITIVAVLFLLLGGAGGIFYKMHLDEQARIKNERDAADVFERFFAGARPENYARTIDALEELFAHEEFGPTEAATNARPKLDELRRQYQHVKDGNDLAQKTRGFVEGGQHRYADALRHIDRYFEKQEYEKASGEGADYARAWAEELRLALEFARDRFVAEALRSRQRELSDEDPTDAELALGNTIADLRSQAYVEDERTDGLDSAEDLRGDLRFSIGRITKYLEPARKALVSTDYGKAERLLEDDRRLYEDDTPLSEALGRLDRNWMSKLTGNFARLETDIEEANRTEWDQVQVAVQQVVQGKKRYGDAVDQLTTFGDRSIRDIADETRQIAEALEEELANLRTEAGDQWDRFLPQYLEYMGNRNWAAADTELMNLWAKLLTHQPNDWESAWIGAKEALDLAGSIEGTALAELEGRDSATLTLGTIRDTVYDIRVDAGARSISFSREPGGAREEKPLRELSVDDVFREAQRPPDDIVARFVRAILRLGEVVRMPDTGAAVRELEIVEGWIGEARQLQLLGQFPERVLIHVRKQERLLEQRLQTDEVRAERIFLEAETALALEQWQLAHDKYSLLLEDRKLRETKWVRDRLPSIKMAIEDTKKKLPAVRIGNYLRTRSRHLSGDSVSSRKYRIAVSYDFRNREELERWRYTEGRVDLLTVEAVIAGPNLLDTTRRQGLLGFLAPENIRERKDWLQNHPLRLESFLLYSRDMSISFRVRFQEPLALLVSLCGTNVLVLSDNGESQNGRGVHIWQSESLLRPDRIAPVQVLRKTYLEMHPDVLKGDAANHRYFQFEPNRWYHVRFEKKERHASLYVSDRLVYERDIKLYGAKGRDIVILTYTACEVDDLVLTGTVDPGWYNRRVK